MALEPTPGEAAVLAEIRSRESSGNYGARISQATCAKLGQRNCTASGAYQFTNPTWQMASVATGVPFFGSAAEAPQWVQDANALWLLRKYGPNATISWWASGVAKGHPYEMPVEVPVYAGTDNQAVPIVDLDGADAPTPTTSILDYWYPDAEVPAGSTGIDWESPKTQILVAAAIAAVGLLLVRSN